MKTKKKPNQIKSGNVIKLLNIKTLQEHQKNTVSTKQKTYATIEQNLRTFENLESSGNRQPFRGRLSFNKKTCLQRMQQHNLSPFSNDGRSASHKITKTPERPMLEKDKKQQKFAINIKDLQRKKVLKNKVTSARQTGTKKFSLNKTVANSSHNNEQKKKFSKKKPLKLDKNQKQQKARIQFQNQFLNMMNNRIHKQRITEISDEQVQSSIRRKPKLQISIQTEDAQRQDRAMGKKQQIVRTMMTKVMKNIQKDYPNLDVSEKKVMCAVIVIQRLWRQKKVKQFFEHYATPKASSQKLYRQSFQKQSLSNRSTINLLTSHLTKKLQSISNLQAVPKKNAYKQNSYENNFLLNQKYSDSSEIGQNRITSQYSVRKQSKLNDKVNRLLDQTISFENQSQKIVKQTSSLDRPAIMKFVQCYRQIKLSAKKSTISKFNIFSLKESLSQKCLMQKYYAKIFSDRPEKDQPKNYELFISNNNKSRMSSSGLQQNQNSSIQIFKEINQNPDYITTKKQESQQFQEQEKVWIRNDTNHSQETDSGQLTKNQAHEKSQKLIVDEGDNQQSELREQKQNPTHKNICPQIEQTLSDSQIRHNINSSQSCITTNQKSVGQNVQKAQPSLKSIQKVADELITQLMNQFFAQYVGFREKQCLVKRSKSSSRQAQKQKKPRLPGIEITSKTINEYLDILIAYIFTNDRNEIQKSLQLFHPSKYQKCHRVQSKIYDIFYIEDEQEDEIYWNIISNQGFFACLEKYWKSNVKLTKQMEKFMNFLDLTYKVYNRCITDAFSQIFNKHVLQMIIYPWNSACKSVLSQRVIKFREQISQHPKTHIKSIQNIASEVKQKLLQQSFCYSSTEGKLIKKQKKLKQQDDGFQFGHKFDEQVLGTQNLSEDQFSRIMKIVNIQYLQDQRELMLCADERYELNGDLGEYIFDLLIGEVQQQMLSFILIQTQEEKFTKSQKQIFFETNQTLQTNCQF